MFERMMKMGELLGDLTPLAALLVALAQKLAGARRFLLGAFIGLLRHFGVVLRLDQRLVDLPHRFVDLQRHGLILRQHRVALFHHVAQKRQQFFAPELLVLALEAAFGSRLIGQRRLRAVSAGVAKGAGSSLSNSGQFGFQAKSPTPRHAKSKAALGSFPPPELELGLRTN